MPMSNAERMRRWRKENPEAARAASARQRNKNPQKANAKTVAWRLKNPEKGESVRFLPERKAA